MSELHRITINPEQNGGRPSIRGMRIRVVDVLELLASGASRKRSWTTTHTLSRKTSLLRWSSLPREKVYADMRMWPVDLSPLVAVHC